MDVIPVELSGPHHASEGLPLDPALEVSCAADRLSLAYRLYLRTLGIGFGVEPVRG